MTTNEQSKSMFNLLSTKLSIKLVFLTIVVMVCAISLLSFYIQISERKVFSEQLDSEGATLAKAIAIFSVEPMLIKDYPVLDTFVNLMVSESSDIVSIKLFRKDGKLVSEALTQKQIKLSSQRSFNLNIYVQGNSANIIGKVELVLSSERADNFVTTRLWVITLVSLVAIVVLAIALYWLIEQLLAKPLKQLSSSAEILSSGNLDKEIQLDSDDELGELASVLDKMRLNLKISYSEIQAQNIELKSLDKAKDSFLARISHEINTPLNGIMGMCSAIDSDMSESDNERIKESFDNINQSALRLKQLTDQLIDFSDSPTHIKLDDTEEVNCFQSLNDILKPCRQKSNLHQNQLNLYCDNDLFFKTNHKIFKQIMMSLLENAIKFTDKGRVNIDVIRLPQDKGLVIAVSDNGLGIAEEKQELIFNNFEQGFDYENREYEGLGLGLSMAKKAVESLNGRVLLKSELGKGSSFILLFPHSNESDIDQLISDWNGMQINLLEKTVSDDTPVQTVIDHPIASLVEEIIPHNDELPKILIVDDEATNRMVLRANLKRDYTILQAENGEQCLQVLRKQQVDLVLLDLMMPVKSGFEVLEIIRQDTQQSYPPIIIISAIMQAKTKTETFNLGAVDYLTKPFNRGELLARVQMHLTLARKENELEQQVSDRTLALRQSHQQLEESHEQLETSHQSLRESNQKLEDTFQYLLHSEKMASIGQLAAGVAHEINNPIGYIQSNVHSLKEYVDVFVKLIEQYQTIEDDTNTSSAYQQALEQIKQIKDNENLAFIVEDIVVLLSDTNEGTERVKTIVNGITGFARHEDDAMKMESINEAIDASIKLVWNELKYKVDMVKNYGSLPEIFCNQSQLIQVFTNLLVNASQAIEGKGTITINTTFDDEQVVIKIKDTGSGIKSENLPKLFDPFFTTKDVGKGTGLGLYLSYEIIKKHQGSISVESEIDLGTTFIINLPV